MCWRKWTADFDIIEVCEKQNIRGFLVTIDIGKAFDSLDHDFLGSALNR